MGNESSKGHRKPRALAANDDHLVKGPTASMSLSWVASSYLATPQWPGSYFTLRNARLAWRALRSAGLRFRLCVLTCLLDHGHQLSSTETSSICCHYQTPLFRPMGLRNGEWRKIDCTPQMELHLSLLCMTAIDRYKFLLCL